MITSGTIASNSPELRGTILAQVLRHIAMTPGPVTYDALFRAALEEVGKPEEECGEAIGAAALLLANAGLIVSNTYADGVLTIGARTELTAAPLITGWVWRDPDGAPAGDNLEGGE